MADLNITNGTVVVPGQEPRAADVAVSDGKIAGIYEPGEAPDAREEVDATGLHVLPGAIDPHVHLGQYKPLEIDTGAGTALAALGGTTTLINYFKNVESYLDVTPGFIETYEAHAHIDAAFHLQLLTEPHLVELRDTYRDFGITSYKINLAWKGKEKQAFDSDRAIDNGWVWAVMEEMTAIDPERFTLNIHCENQELKNAARAKVVDEMEPTLRYFERLAPDFSETDSVMSMLLLARVTGIRTYMVHLSARLTCDALAQLAWAENERLFGETCPHYLMHTVDSPAGLRATVSPPIRFQEDQDALWEALADGRLDTVGSDSNPVMLEEKLAGGDFWKMKLGFDGVGFIVPSMLSGGYHQRGMPLGRIAQIMAENPAKIFGLYPQKGTIAAGSDADLVLVDLEATHTVGDEATGAHSDYSIFEGMTFNGWPVMTISRGEIIAKDGKVLSEPGRGSYLAREVG
jgi:dihydropyrimidinase